MKKGSIYILVFGLAALVSSCAVNLQNYDLAKEYATTIQYDGMDSDNMANEPEEEENSGLVGIPVSNFYGGDLKRGGIWWTGQDMVLAKGDTFVISATNVGPDTIPFGATFPPIDLLVKPVKLKITAKAVGEGGAVPELFLQFDDANGYKANALRPSNKIENTDEFKEYYFELKGMFNQITPVKHKVNGSFVNSIKFFINPGGEGYTGDILITEIKVVPVE